MTTAKSILTPILIEYSSEKHREGYRNYFVGEYKLDYGNTE